MIDLLYKECRDTLSISVKYSTIYGDILGL